MTDIKNFIEENNISFAQGERNTSVVTLIGYAQYLGLTKEELKLELSKEIIEDSFIKEEINRLWDYCKARSYRTYWNTPDAKNRYIFI